MTTTHCITETSLRVLDSVGLPARESLCEEVGRAALVDLQMELGASAARVLRQRHVGALGDRVGAVGDT